MVSFSRKIVVTPFVGVWIETMDLSTQLEQVNVTPFVGVWIETTLRIISNNVATSHPSWVCGLKQIKAVPLQCI